MTLKMDYGRHSLSLTLPDNIDVFLTRDTTPLADETTPQEVRTTEGERPG